MFRPSQCKTKCPPPPRSHTTKLNFEQNEWIEMKKLTLDSEIVTLYSCTSCFLRHYNLYLSLFFDRLAQHEVMKNVLMSLGRLVMGNGSLLNLRMSVR